MSTSAEEVTVERVTAAHEAAVAAFVAAHPQRGPGHCRALAAVEAALGHRDESVVAVADGRVLGFAPARWIEGRTLRVLRHGRLAGGGLVGCGPLVSQSLGASARRDVLGALVDALRQRGGALGARGLSWMLPGFAEGEAGLAASTVSLMDDVLAAGGRLSLSPGLLLDLSASEEELLRGVQANTRRLIRKAETVEVRATSVAGDEARAVVEQLADAAGSAFGGVRGASRALAAVARAVAAPAGHGDGTGALFVTAVRDGAGAVLSAVVTAEANGLAYYFLSFNTEAALGKNANPVGLWAAILAARSRGHSRFLLGSLEYGVGKSAQISAFKRKFGGQPVFAPVAQWAIKPGLDARDGLLTALASGLRRR